MLPRDSARNDNKERTHIPLLSPSCGAPGDICGLCVRLPKPFLGHGKAIMPTHRPCYWVCMSRHDPRAPTRSQPARDNAARAICWFNRELQLPKRIDLPDALDAHAIRPSERVPTCVQVCSHAHVRMCVLSVFEAAGARRDGLHAGALQPASVRGRRAAVSRTKPRGVPRARAHLTLGTVWWACF